MAKGNDGNYLQHSVEIAAAVHLAAERPEGRLHVALAHGMAPFEPCDGPRKGQARALLSDALRPAMGRDRQGITRSSWAACSPSRSPGWCFRLAGRHWSLSQGTPLRQLAIEVAFIVALALPVAGGVHCIT